MSLELLHLCPNCYRLTENPFSLTNGFCTYKCWKLYEEKAEAVGGHHVLARDEAIRDLKKEVAARDQRIATLEALLYDLESRAGTREAVA